MSSVIPSQPLTWFTASLSEKTQLNDRFLHVHFELVEPSVLTFRAGQYIILEIPGSEKKNSYSISSSPDLNHAIELLIDLSPSGKGTQYLQSLRIGEKIRFLAPAGHFVVDPEQTVQEQSMQYIATGSGIAPIKSMIVDQLRFQQDERPITLYWGMRYESELFWLDKFQNLQKQFPNFHLHLVLSQAQDGWTLCRGRVTDCLSFHELDIAGGFYLCGNGTMIKDVKALLLEKKVEISHIHHEAFYS
ncbi:MAG: hypothetical protein UX04_C0005G0052 [Microgenomates group bacterium GW2011_GWF2_45_18]|nr:MAG: hypothetical protein UW18_C0007G0052 [Microgenomates group bacterium GW2011_GWF1_44_10]KKU01633.1 MAG: hypothetical protein UX04_C0005G0052 [Microgenomates group bacterium GW2011_GWF2_45_18]HAU99485.1 hypothetical protein [Candidatus Paceibacterota bacterium]HAX01456.1 hypothetical protein [Candidatus Paceibacterota bacterium]